MSDDPPSQACQAWSRYWLRGILESCAGSVEGSDSDSLVDFWKKNLLTVCSPDQVIVDFGCGNGPIAKLLANKLHESPSYIGIDYAELSPQWVQMLESKQKEKIRFLKGQDCRNPAIQPGTADWLVSQFGAEYAGLFEAVSAGFKILKPKGKLHWIIHHRDSLILRRAQEETKHIDFLRQENGLFELAESLIEPFASAASASKARQLNRNKHIRKQRDQYNQALDLLADRCATSSSPDLLLEARDWISQILQRSRIEGAANAKKRLIELDSLLSDSKERLRQLDAVAQTPATLRQHISDALDDQIYNGPRIETISQAGELLALSLSLDKHAA